MSAESHPIFIVALSDPNPLEVIWAQPAKSIGQCAHNLLGVILASNRGTFYMIGACFPKLPGHMIDERRSMPRPYIYS